MPSCCRSCTNRVWEARTLTASGCSTLRPRERTTLTGAGGQRKRVVRSAGSLRDPWPRPTRRSRTATNGRTIEGRKGVFGTASITVPPGRPDRRKALDPEMTGNTPVARVLRAGSLTIHTRSVHILTGRRQSVLPLIVLGRIDRTQTVRTRTDRLQIRPRTDRPYSDRPHTDRPTSERPRTDRPYADRPRTEGPRLDGTPATESGDRTTQARTVGSFSLLRVAL